MARGRKRKRQSKANVQYVEELRDKEREQNFMNSEVRADGVGEDPIIKALIYDLPNASQEEALEIALAFQQRLRGDASLLESPELSHMISTLREEASEVDKAAERYEKDNVGFVNDVITSAPKMTDKEKAKVIAREHSKFGHTVKMAKAGKATKQLQFKDMLQRSPLETIHVTGHFMIENGKQTLKPDVVSILGSRFVLKPGVHDVPVPIANAYKNMLRTRSQSQAKKALLSGDGQPNPLVAGWEMSQLAGKLAEVNNEYGSN